MELYKYCPFNKYTLENLEKRQIFFNVVNDVNDPYEGIINLEVQPNSEYEFLKFFYQDRVDEEVLKHFTFEELKTNVIFDNVNFFLRDAGISCFSETNTSLTMWGNYADKNKGICIGYDSNLGVFRHAQKVTYRDDVIKINVDTPDKVSYEFLKSYFDDALYSKYQEWAYEKEWRIISEKLSTCSYPNSAIKAIYFGLKTTENDIRRVYEVTKNNPILQYYKAVLGRDKYNLEYIRL